MPALQARLTCHEAMFRLSLLWTSQTLAVPSAAEGFKDINLKLDQAGIGGGDRCVERHERLFRGE